MRKLNLYKRGFTLIEVLCSMTIIFIFLTSILTNKVLMKNFNYRNELQNELLINTMEILEIFSTKPSQFLTYISSYYEIDGEKIILNKKEDGYLYFKLQKEPTKDLFKYQLEINFPKNIFQKSSKYFHQIQRQVLWYE